MSSRTATVLAALTCMVCWFPQTVEAQATAELNSGTVQGTVFTSGQSGERAVVPSAKVRLQGRLFSQETASGENGKYCFRAVPPGTYQLRVEAPSLLGSSMAKVLAGEVLDVAVEMKVEAVKDSVTVTSSASDLGSNEPSVERAVDKAVILNAPNKEDRIDALLPLVPGVVRGPDGLINMKGARASQAGYLVNSANATDPVTGSEAISLPIDVVESVKVIADPYDPEYGRLTGALASVETITGNFNRFRATAQNLMPRMRRRDGDFVGIEAATPRLTLTGPLLRNKIAFTQSFEYRFIRTPVESLPPLQRDTKLESFNSFSQVDANLTDRQTLTASFALYPQKFNYLGLNTFVPQPSTPDLHQRGYMASIQHHYVAGSDSIVVSRLSYKSFDADVTANSADPYQLLVETTTGGIFDRQRRQSHRTEWQEGYQHDTHGFLGAHQLKAGINYAHSDYDGRTQLLPVTILGSSDSPIERIKFGPASRFNIDQNEVAWFLADKWTPVQRLTLDLGLRFDHDSITHSTNTAPRAGFALALTGDSKTLLKGGVGLFYDRVPLNTASFALLPDRTIETLGPAEAVLDSTPYANTISGRLRNPRSVGWNFELDRQITSELIARVGFQDRNTVRDFVLNPEANPGQGTLSLSNGGRSSYREFQIEAQYKLKRQTLNASYVRSKAYGDLNDFNQFFGNNAVAVIEPNSRGRLPFDAPNRFLFWGQFEAPFKLTMMPVLDVHTGFPYSRINQEREFVGARDSQRFPLFNSLDLQVTRPIRLPIPHKDVKARIGFSVFNVFNRFNPRDVQSDIDSYRYGAFFNGVGRTFRGKFIWEF
jgi:Carboxypeptidase regulatory-like domain/TonB dependent receptor-like, beta-barrel